MGNAVFSGPLSKEEFLNQELGRLYYPNGTCRVRKETRSVLEELLQGGYEDVPFFIDLKKVQSQLTMQDIYGIVAIGSAIDDRRRQPKDADLVVITGQEYVNAAVSGDSSTGVYSRATIVHEGGIHLLNMTLERLEEIENREGSKPAREIVPQLYRRGDDSEARFCFDILSGVPIVTSPEYTALSSNYMTRNHELLWKQKDQLHGKISRNTT